MRSNPCAAITSAIHGVNGGVRDAHVPPKAGALGAGRGILELARMRGVGLKFHLVGWPKYSPGQPRPVPDLAEPDRNLIAANLWSPLTVIIAMQGRWL